VRLGRNFACLGSLSVSTTRQSCCPSFVDNSPASTRVGRRGRVRHLQREIMGNSLMEKGGRPNPFSLAYGTFCKFKITAQRLRMRCKYEKKPHFRLVTDPAGKCTPHRQLRIAQISIETCDMEAGGRRRSPCSRQFCAP
jgi:hypothetical protein